MPENESRNPRLVTHPRVFQSSYNTKDPPKIGSRRGPVSREALSSFSKFLEHFHPEAHTQYLRERKSIKRGSWTLGELYTRYDRKCAELQLGVYAARHSKSLKVVLSSAEPEPLLAPPGFKSSPPRVACELPPSTSEMGLPISQPSLRLGACVKPLEWLNTTVLNREPPKGSSLMGTKPSNRVTSELTSPSSKRATIRNAVESPQAVMKRKEVSSVKAAKGTSATKHSPMPKAAPMLLKSTPVFSIRAPPAPSPKDRIFPSSRANLTLHTPNTTSTHRIMSDVTRRKIATQLRVSNMPVSQVPLVSPSSQMISTLRTTDVVNMRRGGKGTTCWNPVTRTPSQVSHSTTLPLPGKSPISVRRLPSIVRQKPAVGLKVKTRTRVSLKTATPQFGKIPFADGIERSDDRSNVITGPAVEQALNLFSTEVGEGRRVTDTVVSIHDEDRDKCSPSSSTTFMLQTSAPSALPVPPMRVISQLHRSVDPIPPSEVVPRRRGLNVVNKTSLSHPSFTPPSSGGGQLARVAAYIRERSTRRSPAFDKFTCWTPKVPPDKMTDPDTLRQVPSVVSENEKASGALRSPESTVESVVLSHSQPEAVLSQPNGPAEAASLLPETLRANKRLTKRSKSTPKFTGPTHDTSNIGVQKGRTVQLVEAVEADRRSAERLEEIKEISDKLVMPALEEAERPPNLMEQQPELLAVSKAEMSAQSHSPIPSAALTPLTPLPAFLSRAMSINQPSLGLDWLLLKPPDGVGFKQCLYDTISVSFTLSVTLRSPEFEMGFNPVF